MRNLYSEDAFTGLEAAIVLIAFVVVAAVFSYVVLGAGFFTSQTAQATVHTGVQQASSSMELVGNVYGISAGSSPLTSVNMTVALTAGGTAMDLGSMVVSYSDDSGAITPSLTRDDVGTLCAAEPAAGHWCIGQQYNVVGTSNDILDPSEEMILAIGMPATADSNAIIKINLQPSIGAVLPITRRVPGTITTVQPLY